MDLERHTIDSPAESKIALNFYKLRYYHQYKQLIVYDDRLFSTYLYSLGLDTAQSKTENSVLELKVLYLKIQQAVSTHFITTSTLTESVMQCTIDRGTS